MYLGSAVSHQLRFTVRRDEADSVLRLKLGELHTPAELEEELVNLLSNIGLGLTGGTDSRL